MYERIWSDYTSGQNTIRERTLHLGKAAKLIREQSRRTKVSVARDAGLGSSLLGYIELQPELHSTWEKTERLATALGISTEKLFERGREEFPYNFFTQTEDNRPCFEYDGTSIFPYSPPISSQNDFLLLKVVIRPGKSVSPCLHTGSREIACYVLDGPITFKFGDETHSFKGNQSFFFDGSVEHGFLNENPGKTVKFYVCLNPPSSATDNENKLPARKKGLDLVYALEYVRRKASPLPGVPLPWSMIEKMTGVSLRELMQLQGGRTKIIPWRRLEAIACGTGIPLNEIIGVATGKLQGRLEICTALTRGHLNYEDQFGIRIYSAVRPGVGRRRFFIGQVFLKERAKFQSTKRRWRYQTNAMMCLVVQDGRILVEYGDRKKAALSTGDSVYFDANLEFIIHNLEYQESKFYLFTQPPLF